MTVLTVTLANNESKLIRHFVRHYRRLGDVTVYDDHSEDNTAVAALAEGATVISIGDREPHDLEQRIIWVKNHSWKPVRDNYDWIIAVDTDEFLYHDNLIEVLRHSLEMGVPILLPCGYEVASREPPRDDIPITSQMRRGAFTHPYSKPCCFNPRKVDEMNFWVGSHHAVPSGNWHFFFPYPGLKLLHYRYLGTAWVVDRLSRQNRPWGVDDEKMDRDIAALNQRSFEIIPEGPINWFAGAPASVPLIIEAVPDLTPAVRAAIANAPPQPPPPELVRVSSQPMGRWFLGKPVLPSKQPG